MIRICNKLIWLGFCISLLLVLSCGKGTKVNKASAEFRPDVIALIDTEAELATVAIQFAYDESGFEVTGVALDHAKRRELEMQLPYITRAQRIAQLDALAKQIEAFLTKHETFINNKPLQRKYRHLLTATKKTIDEQKALYPEGEDPPSYDLEKLKEDQESLSKLDAELLKEFNVKFKVHPGTDREKYVVEMNPNEFTGEEANLKGVMKGYLASCIYFVDSYGKDLISDLVPQRITLMNDYLGEGPRADFTSDLHALNEEEQRLAEVGIKLSFDDSSVRVDPDLPYWRSFLKASPCSTTTALRHALSDYTDTTKAFLSKHEAFLQGTPLKERFETTSTYLLSYSGRLRRRTAAMPLDFDSWSNELEKLQTELQTMETKLEKQFGIRFKVEQIAANNSYTVTIDSKIRVRGDKEERSRAIRALASAYKEFLDSYDRYLLSDILEKKLTAIQADSLLE